jgi:protein-tyrosine phosphatase
VIDLHCHILPELDDGPKTWEESLDMARRAVDDGIQVVVATPHLFKNRRVEIRETNSRELILATLEEFRQRLRDAAIPLAVLPGCDVPLSLEAMDLLEAGQVLTINDGQRYLLLELPDTALPPALESICFRLQTKGLTPIITHPERHMLFQEMPEKLGRLLDLGCLAQLTAGSLLGNFGRRVAKISRKLVKQGYIHILASDAHNNRSRPPELSQAVQEMARLVGQDAALAMVTATPERIIQGQPFN